MITLVQLETFIELYYTGSFIKASQKLVTTQSTVSKRIQELEQQLSVKLMKRKQNRGGISLTVEGEILLKYAEEIIAKKNKLIDEITQQSLSCTKIKIGSSETLIYLNLSKKIKQFNQVHPNINIHLEVANSKRLKDLLLKGKIDIAFMMGPPKENNIIYNHLYSCDMVFYSASNLGHHFIPLEKIANNHSIITFDEDTLPYKNLVNQLSYFKVAEPLIHNCSSLHSIIQMTTENIGVGLIPKPVAQAYHDRQEIFPINTVAVEQMHFYACYLRNNALSDYLDLLLACAYE